jgi:tetratricopeptide (TPR) repeat protein
MAARFPPARKEGVLLVFLLFWNGCSRNAPEDLEALHRQVKTILEAGDMVRAADLADRGRDLALKRRDKVFDWRFRLAKATALLFNLRAEAALPLLEGPVPELPGSAGLDAERLLLQSRAFSYLHRNEESESLLDRARQAAEAAHAVGVLTDIEIVKGLRLEREGRSRDSEAVLRHAREMARSGGSRYQEGAILVNLGMAKIHKNRYDEAAADFEEAASVAGMDRPLVYRMAQQNLAICYASLGEVDRAIEIGLESIQFQERSGAKTYLSDALGELGRNRAPNIWIAR